VNILQGLRAVALASGFKRGEFIGDTNLSPLSSIAIQHHRFAHKKIGPPHISLDAVKHFSREILAAEPGVAQREPFWWLHVPITFDAADHPDCCLGMGTLPLVVSPVIRNVQVTKMLVDGGAGFDLISIKLMEKLLISKKDLTPTDVFRGAFPGVTHPLGKVTLPVTFGMRNNYRT
jgi:hypothetical protein